MISASDDNDFLVSCTIHKAMLVSYSARPIARQVGFERFWLSDTSEGLTHYVFDKEIYTLEDFAIMLLPP